ncbi:MAG: PQQ-binding-like beta-propeller repeat protein [Planctomycetaceae bacterium]
MLLSSIVRPLALAGWFALGASSLWAAEVSEARHKVLASDKGHLVQYDADGEVEWSIQGFGPVHRIQQLTDGHLLTQKNFQHLVELDEEQSVVWEYNSSKQNGNDGKRVEVHAFQRLADGNTMIVENGIGRIIEVDRDGKIVHELKYQVKQLNAHRDVRQGRKLENGHYLLCHEADGRVTEYASDGKIVWDYNVPLFDREPKPGHGPEAWGNQVFNALRLKSGNTLIATGNGHAVIEVTPEKEIVWQLHQNDLEGITLAWTTTLEVLENGNIILGNCHAGPKNPQLIEVNLKKEVVWTFRDFEELGDSTAASATVGGANVQR